MTILNVVRHILLYTHAVSFLSGRSNTKGSKETAQIGFLVADDNHQKDNLLKLVSFAEERFNNASRDVSVQIVVQTYDQFSLYGLVEATCSLVEEGVFAVISPEGSSNVANQADILGPLNIPLLSIVATDPQIKRVSRRSLLLLSAGDDYQARAILDLLKFYDWNEVSLVASDTSYGTNAINAFQNLLSLETSRKFSIKSSTFFRATSQINQINFTSTLGILKRSLTRVVILICESKYAKPFFEAANQMEMMTSGYVWIVTDAITANPRALAFGGFYPSYYEGLIGITPSINTNSNTYKTFKDELLLQERSLTADNLTPHMTLTYDAITLVGKVLNNLQYQKTEQSASCKQQISWNSGELVSRKLRSTPMNGITGFFNFTSEGLRAKAAYNIVNFVNPGVFAHIGHWKSHDGLHMPYHKDSDDVKFIGGVTYHPRGSPKGLSGEHLRLGVTNNAPFAAEMRGCEGTKCWEGITPDTIRQLAAVMNFTYEFVEPEDKLFGTYNKETEVWTGLIGDLLSNRIDMIAMDLSVSFERKTYIDFSVSFMDSGISLAVRGQSDKGNVFFFLSPFSESVWIMVIVSILIVSLIQSLFNKLSPSGEYGRIVHAMQVCGCTECVRRREITVQENVRLKDYKDTECLVDQAKELSKEDMSLFNAVWIVGAGFVGQAGEAMPTSSSGRFVLFTWWFFVMLMTSLYTANLTAFITLDKIGVKIDNAKDLLSQNRYTWGILNDSFVEALLENNIDSEYKKILDRAEKLTSVADGVQRVRDGNFVFIDETPAISYNVMGECDIFYVGGEVQTFDYAFGFPKNSPYSPLINTQLIRLREQGFFDEVWKTWDKTPDHVGCGSSNNNSKGVTLTLTNVRGIFLFLSIGIVISVMLILIEMVIAAHKDEGDADHLSFSSKLSRRFRLKILDIKTQWVRQSNRKTIAHFPINGKVHFPVSADSDNGIELSVKPLTESEGLEYEQGNMV